VGVHTRSAKARRALPGGVRHGYHHASHHRTCHSAGWRRRARCICMELESRLPNPALAPPVVKHAQQKITLREMRSSGVASWCIAPTIIARTRCASAPIDGPTVFGCPILSRYSSVRRAADGVRIFGRIGIGNYQAAMEALILVRDVRRPDDVRSNRRHAGIEPSCPSRV
jgi:hypothetical protein